YAPGLASIPPLDRDEPRFAHATRQMLETGDFIRIRFQDEARNKKPIGIHWLQAASVAACSTPESNAIWPYRLPSALSASAAVLGTFALGGRLLSSRRAGFVAAVLMASALGLVAEAHLATTDAALLLAVVTGQGALGLVYVACRTGRPVSRALIIVFWLAEAAGILLKGPPAPLLALLTAMSLTIGDRDIGWIKRLRPVVGLVLAAVVVVPWLVVIEGASAGWARGADSGIAVRWGVVWMVLAAALVLLPIHLGPGFSFGPLAAAAVLLALAIVLLSYRRRPVLAVPLTAAMAAAFVLPAAI